jgi:hypothetical protein
LGTNRLARVARRPQLSRKAASLRGDDRKIVAISGPPSLRRWRSAGAEAFVV